MKTDIWRCLLASALSLLLVSGTSAQATTTLPDLGTLLAGNNNLTTFNSLIQEYPQILLKLVSYSGVTILAPSDEAFEKIPYTSLNEAWASNNSEIIMNVLEYHILQGTRMAASLIPGSPIFIPTLLTDPEWSSVSGGQRVLNVKQAGDVVVFVTGQGSRSTSTTADLQFTGGVIQVIDSLLIPPSNFTSTTNVFNLTSFEGACYVSDLVSNFSAPDVTIFAPANSALEALGPAISNMTSAQLVSVMSYHLVPSVIYSTGLTNASILNTTNGGKLTVRHSGNSVYINSAQLVASDILIANGVLHIIDNVLNPQGPGAEPNPILPTQVPAFASASKASDIPFTSALPCTTSCPVPVTMAESTATGGAGGGRNATSTSAGANGGKTSSSKGVGAAMARVTGFGRAVGFVVTLGGAVMMI